MKLILLLYFRLLRESGEFDALLPDLLLAMNIVPISKPQKGVRQAGVDIAAVGPDEHGVRTLWLFVLKRGDLSRRDWDSSSQAVRQSLDEITDVYLRANVLPEHKDLPVRVVVATTGDFKQDFEQQRAGYADINRTATRSYDFWNGDVVASKLERHLLNEFALPEPMRSDLRRVLALIGEPDYQLEHWHALLKGMLRWKAQAASEKDRGKDDCLQDLRTLTLALGILCRWAAQEGNLKNAVLACERALLWSWDAIRQGGWTEKPEFIDAYLTMVGVYLNTTTEYFNKVQTHLHLRDAFAKYHREAALLTESVFEQIGLLASMGLAHLLFGYAVKDQGRTNGAGVVAASLAEFLKTHSVSASPCYDAHAIDIDLALTFLSFAKRPLRMTSSARGPSPR